MRDARSLYIRRVYLSGCTRDFGFAVRGTVLSVYDIFTRAFVLAFLREARRFFFL